MGKLFIFKSKKKQSFIFKVDFEKAYDSVRWDFLDEVLKKFRFGDKWCTWIRSCLRSSRGSIVINGSSTAEFQFHKGLKQGDSLSPFLFILIMESLHLSFQRVVDARMFNGITLSSSLMLSHMVYADDVIFVGQWLESIRSHFFNGHDPNSKRTSWVKWKNVLASKEKGGHGVSSLYALNRGLMFKWVWRFFTQNTSLWSRVIKAIHGEDGKVGKQVKSAFPSYWMDIVYEINVL
ncbi:RNA-directed DNA polymerase, eukaryota, reverse transcriptase zinc-binding domain protein [Tanacetum coccineum]